MLPDANVRSTDRIAHLAGNYQGNESGNYELMANDEVESIHVGRVRRIPTDALVTYIDRQRNEHARYAD
jgi:hypothetical protein